RYHKIQHGPAAAALVPVRDEVIDEGVLELRHEKIGGKYQPQVRFVAHREADLSAFKEDELLVVDEVINKYKDMNGTQISEESYKELGVLLAQENEDIPYGTVYLPDAPPTKDDIAYAQRRMKERGWAAG
ncbi:MAG TPA: type II toxin-antitoxin system antitoxin SocA domain-containing protein, partial [Candidatus Limnocylindria bacterium]|nr:type II toxin-antitoxin system antitoxin SocA domain-containing protein [Candidatus Limnocylindria bacterium]